MFTLFMDLAPELRLEIWQHAIPKVDLPGLAIYKKDCWQPRFLTPSDWDYDDKDPDNIRFEFRYDLLPVAFTIPLAFVNREARGVVLSWVQRSGPEIQYNESQPHFQRRMNHYIDTLYLPMDRIEEFDAEPLDRQFEEDMVHRMVGVVPYIRHFAISEDLFYSEEPIPESWEWFNIETIHVIVGQQPDEHGHWDVVDRGERTITWGVERGFEMGDGGTILNDDLCRRIMADKNGLGECLRSNHGQGWPLVIRLITVAKK
ncbi:hypothetical protein BKA59DRAFT_467085 [Fusarium tricinctum]|uniref:2EXR domain-containing protein n=1 Tax=Fusarium tricinctum TaxID=61284 RepID=A0A8K0S7B1_9HYPO|nr:hypothetical protein BKA59DRAFT_467085 [Fusarium tricinctum]